MNSLNRLLRPGLPQPMGIALKFSIMGGTDHYPGVLTGGEVSKDFGDIPFSVKDMNHMGGRGHLSRDGAHGFDPAIGLLLDQGTPLLGLLGGGLSLLTLLRGLIGGGRNDRRTVPKRLPQQPLWLPRFGVDRQGTV